MKIKISILADVKINDEAHPYLISGEEDFSDLMQTIWHQLPGKEGDRIKTILEWLFPVEDGQLRDYEAFVPTLRMISGILKADDLQPKSSAKVAAAIDEWLVSDE
jgi:hypothetical protein